MSLWTLHSMRSPFALVAMLLLVSACASHRVPEALDSPSGEGAHHTNTPSRPAAPDLQVGIEQVSGKPRILPTIVYECDDSTVVVTQLDAPSGGLWVFLPEETVLLPHVPAASGAYYSNGAVSVWSKGSQAMIEVSSVQRRCTENRRRSVIEDAKLRGNDFWASGNEPGWTLEIGPEFTVLRTEYGQTLYTLRTRSPETSAEARRSTYDLEVQGTRVRIVVEDQPCNDSMSGEAFPSTVTVEVGERTLYGCGLALH